MINLYRHNLKTKLRSLICICAFSASISLNTGNAWSTEEPLMLSLDTAVLFALNSSPDINIVGEQKEQAQYAIDEAKSLLYPQVTFTATVGIESNDPAAFPPDAEQTSSTSNTNDSQEYSLLVNQLVFDGYSTSSEIKKREQIHKSSEYEIAIIRQDTIMNTVESYLSVYQFQQSIAHSDRLINKLNELNAKIEVMVEAGAESLAKLKYAQSRLSFAMSEKTNTEASLSDALANLEFLTGRLPVFTAVQPQIFDILEHNQRKYIELAGRKNTTLLLNTSDKKATELELKKTQGTAYPSMTLLAEYRDTEDLGGEIGGDTTASVVMQMNYQIFDGFARKATTNRVKSEIREVEFQRLRIQRNIQQDIKTAYNQMRSFERELAIVEDEVITNTELQDLYREQFELGEGDIINLIEGEERLYRSHVRKYQIEADLLKNGMELIQQIGLLDKHLFCTEC